ncbi:MAG: P-loop NTPase [Acidilobaceae archaeon]|nr:P-loop NTPase [Acidilobaceae archaeon]MCX8166066.1 P-loop NTPase [Acidilobaceae archaeon]MDW7974709.1 P-loop NTPase [Sulfolobales archaeon]
MMDFRAHRVKELFREVKTFAVLSSKGGVGKTTFSAVLSMLLAKGGAKVALADLDLTNSTTQLVLGVHAEGAPVEEGKGFKPLNVAGVKFVSPLLFTRGRPLALRGSSASEALRELLVAAEWGELDFIVLDMPPGLKDEALEVASLGARLVVLTTQDPLSLHSVSRALRFFKEEGVEKVGVLENMAYSAPLLREEAGRLGFKHLGTIGFDRELSAAIGRPERMMNTSFARDVEKIVPSLVAL